MKSLLCTLALGLALAANLAAQELLTLEVPWTAGVRLADFGGPDLEVCIRSREMTHVVAEIVDYTRLVPIARANVSGVIVDPVRNTAAVLANPDAKMVPMKTMVRVEKKRGVPFEGGRYEMYLLLDEPESGIAVDLLDSIARQNHDNVVVSLPKVARTARRDLPAGENAQPSFIPEMADWYRRLLEERQSLNVNDPSAVEQFNRHAAEYHSALEKTRAAQEALKRAPGRNSR